MQLFEDIKQILSEARLHTYKTVNAILLQTYWQIGRCIVENEQNGQNRAEYGKKTLLVLSEKLTHTFGKGFDFTNLTNMRKFYIAFPIFDALRQELS